MPKRTSSQRPGAPPITRTRVVIPRLGEQAVRFAPFNPNFIARLPDPIFQFAPLIRDQTSSGYRPVVPIQQQQPPPPAEVSSDDESYTADESYDSSVQFDDENDDQSDENDDQSDENDDQSDEGDDQSDEGDEDDEESEDEISVDETTDWTDQGDDDNSMSNARRDDADLAERLAKLIKENTTYRQEDLYDENGKRRPLADLIAMARYSPIWPFLSDFEKSQLSTTPGVLANNRHFISRKVRRSRPLPRARPFVINANGERFDIETTSTKK